MSECVCLAIGHVGVSGSTSPIRYALATVVDLCALGLYFNESCDFSEQKWCWIIKVYSPPLWLLCIVSCDCGVSCQTGAPLCFSPWWSTTLSRRPRRPYCSCPPSESLITRSADPTHWPFGPAPHDTVATKQSSWTFLKL